MLISGWAEGSQSYVVRLGMADPPKLTRRSTPPLLAVELLDPDDLAKKKLLVPKLLKFRIPENYLRSTRAASTLRLPRCSRARSAR